MYVDLVGSINMSMTLPVDKLVSIMRAFTYEMSYVIQSHKGYVLKYVGDKVIAFFPSSYNKLLACDNAMYFLGQQLGKKTGTATCIHDDLISVRLVEGELQNLKPSDKIVECNKNSISLPSQVFLWRSNYVYKPSIP
jgi:hypothetical protein